MDAKPSKSTLNNPSSCEQNEAFLTFGRENRLQTESETLGDPVE